MANHWLQERRRKDNSKQIVLMVKGSIHLHSIVSIGLTYTLIDPQKPALKIDWNIKEPLEIIGYAVLKDGLMVWSQMYSTTLHTSQGDMLSLKFTDADIEHIKQL